MSSQIAQRVPRASAPGRGHQADGGRKRDSHHHARTHRAVLLMLAHARLQAVQLNFGAAGDVLGDYVDIVPCRIS